MAAIGMKYPVWAPIESYTPGSPVVYGEGVVMGEAVSADVTWQRANAEQYGDDALVESDDSITGGSITVESTHVSFDAAQKIWGLVKRSVNEKDAFTTTGGGAPYGGCGWIDVLRVKGVDSYVVNWVYKVQLGRDSKRSATKAQNLTFQNASQQGKAMAVQTDETMKDYFMDEIPCDTLQDAFALLKSLAHISDKAAAAAVEGGA